jgi:aryl-alcohol dehydrogenase-like predicted oxidoreductase
MERQQFGKTDMQVSALGFGGAEIGYQGVSPNTVKDLLSEALNQGLNVIDTAECYRGSEELIGEAVSTRRDDFYLFTKCGHRDNYTQDAWSKSDISKSIDRSLKRLRTDRVDLLQLHSCSEQILRQGDVIEALQEAKQAGKTHYIGYSGDSTDALYAISTGAFDSLQTSLNIADQEAIELTIPLAVEKQMGIIAKRPIANAAWKTSSKPGDPYLVPYWERLQRLHYDFINGTGDSFSKALRFTLSVPGVNVAIVGTTKPGRWKENAEMLAEGKLSESEFEEIRDHWRKVAQKDWVGQI